jgi:hypothetical protein
MIYNSPFLVKGQLRLALYTNLFKSTKGMIVEKERGLQMEDSDLK